MSIKHCIAPSPGSAQCSWTDCTVWDTFPWPDAGQSSLEASAKYQLTLLAPLHLETSLSSLLKGYPDQKEITNITHAFVHCAKINITKPLHSDLHEKQLSTSWMTFIAMITLSR
jgi:hypothetical protein